MKIILHLILLSLLVSCTGTPDGEPPVFVIAGVENAGLPQLVLLRDTYRETNGSSRFKFEEDTEVNLNAPAIAFDVVDRVNTRSELIVLTRDDDGTSFLEFFSLLGIETAANFVETASKQITLSTLNDLPTTIDLCPTSLQVTRDGSLAAISNNPRLCNGPDNEISLLLIDIKNKKYLNHLTKLDLEFIPDLSALPGIIDQGNDTLYFLTERGRTVELNRLERNQFTSSDPGERVTRYTPPIQTIDGQSSFIKRTSDVLVLTPIQATYTYTTLSGDKLENTNIPTLSQGQSFIPDYTNQYNQVFVLSNNRIAIHQDPKLTTIPNRIEGSTTSTLGTINTFTDFMYLARDNVIEVYDLLELQNNPTSVGLEVETATDNTDLQKLNNPTILTWVQGITELR